jgi:hypothetical protein
MLAPGFKAEVGRQEKNNWHKIIQEFDDLSIYQTWSYEVPRRGPDAINHLVLRDERGVVAAAQVRIMTIPWLQAGVAYVPWGPLWKVKGERVNPEVFRQVIRALRNEYAAQRGMLLRIFPYSFEDEDLGIRTIFLEEGFREQKKKGGDRTLILDIRPDIHDLRKNLHQKWRNCLNQAEKKHLDVIEGDDDGLFRMFIGLYQEMLERKKFRQPNDINEFRQIQGDLPDGWKLRIFLCRADDGIGAGAICSALGNKGIYLFGATNNIGLANKGAYLLQWRIIQWLKATGCIYYDLNGIDPIRNPGTYRFKAGISGANGRDVFFLGRYDSYSTAQGFFISRWGDHLLLLLRQFKGLSKKVLAKSI